MALDPNSQFYGQMITWLQKAEDAYRENDAYRFNESVRNAIATASYAGATTREINSGLDAYARNSLGITDQNIIDSSISRFMGDFRTGYPNEWDRLQQRDAEAANAIANQQPAPAPVQATVEAAPAPPAPASTVSSEYSRWASTPEEEAVLQQFDDAYERGEWGTIRDLLNAYEVSDENLLAYMNDRHNANLNIEQITQARQDISNYTPPPVEATPAPISNNNPTQSLIRLNTPFRAGDGQTYVQMTDDTFLRLDNSTLLPVPGQATGLTIAQMEETLRGGTTPVDIPAYMANSPDVLAAVYSPDETTRNNNITGWSAGQTQDLAGVAAGHYAQHGSAEGRGADGVAVPVPDNGILPSDQWTGENTNYQWDLPLDPTQLTTSMPLNPNATPEEMGRFIEGHIARHGNNDNTWRSIGAYARATGITKERMLEVYPHAANYINQYYGEAELPAMTEIRSGTLQPNVQNYTRMLAEQATNPNLPSGTSQLDAHRDVTIGSGEIQTPPPAIGAGSVERMDVANIGEAAANLGFLGNMQNMQEASTPTGYDLWESTGTFNAGAPQGPDAVAHGQTGVAAHQYNAATAAPTGTAGYASREGLSAGATQDAANVPANQLQQIQADGIAKTVHKQRAADLAATNPNAVYDPNADFQQATTYYQLEKYFGDISNGNIPTWARPVVQQVEGMLAARGVARNSTVAKDSLYAAIVASAMPAAQADAQAFQKKWELEFSNEEKTILFNAANAVQRDIANSTYAQTLARDNAQKLFQLDITNMTNEQRSKELTYSAMQAAILSDQAASNAARQFNANSQNQVDQFILSLAQTIEQQNAVRADEMTRARAATAVQATQIISDSYARQVEMNSRNDLAREQFNTNMAMVIDQSNVAWRRQINSLNQAAQNAARQADAMNKFQLSNQALAALWQETRDQAYWNFLAEQNSAANAVNYASLAAQADIASRNINLQTRAFDSQNFWNSQAMQVWNTPGKSDEQRVAEMQLLLNAVGFLAPR